MLDETQALAEARTVIAPDDIRRLEAAFPLVESRGGDVEALARAAGVTVATAQAAMDDPRTAVLLIDAQNAAEDEGRLLKPVAARLTLAMLNKLGAEVDADTLDADDIANLLPKVHKLVEHADRIEAGRGDGYDGLATFNITFVNGGITATVVPAADVIDVESVRVPE